ncbi:MAG: prephenate/arogenate dehydrogenase family protein [Pseudomonadota bacterium]
MPNTINFDRVCLIGVGLIGSSLVLAIRENNLSKEIIGFDLNDKALIQAKSLGIIDEARNSLDEAVENADLIIIATPVGASSEIIHTLSKNKTTALIIDVGSVKATIVDAAQAVGKDLTIVPCHPIAGTEQSGPEAGFARLFNDRWCIVTPLPRTDDAYRRATETAAALWRAVGSKVEIMDAAHHDLALAVTSHLPHLIAFTLVGAADDLENVNEAEIVKYSAGGFRDFTRIAASDPVMWRDVFLGNKEAVLEVLGRFSEELSILQRAIRWGDAQTLEQSFSRGRRLRRAIVEAGQETGKPNFGRDR